MAINNDSIKKKTPKKKARPSTCHLNNEPTNDEESYGSVEEYLLDEAVEPRKKLSQGAKVALEKDTSPHTSLRMKNPSQLPPHL